MTKQGLERREVECAPVFRIVQQLSETLHGGFWARTKKGGVEGVRTPARGRTRVRHVQDPRRLISTLMVRVVVTLTLSAG